MLTKLMKYDFRSIRRFGLPMIIILIAVYIFGALNSVLMAIASQQLNTPDAAPIWVVIMLLTSLFQLLVSFVSSGAAIAMQIIILVDFYQTLVTDQGYLTFTLPVRPSQILTSKLICGSLWSLIVTVITVVGLLGVELASAAGLANSLDVGLTMDIIQTMFQELLSEVPFADMMIMGTMLILLIPVSLVNSLLLYYMAIFFASVVSRKNRVVVAIGSIFGVNFLYGIIASIVIFVIFLFSGVIAALAESVTLMLELFLGLMLLILAGTTVLFFWLTKYMMEKKLNLP